MSEPSAAQVLREFSRVAQMDSGASLDDRLRSAGWSENDPGSGGLHRQWTLGKIIAAQYGRGPSGFLEVTLELVRPKPEDPRNEEELLLDFENRFEGSLVQAVSALGDATFVGAYGDEGFPEDLDAVLTAQWLYQAGTAALNLKHEDQGAPFRITTTVN